MTNKTAASKEAAYFIYISALLGKLDGTLNFAGTQATSANVDALNLTVYNGANALDIRLPGTLSFQMGMAYIHTAKLALIANFTNMCHVKHLLNQQLKNILTQYKYNSKQ